MARRCSTVGSMVAGGLLSAVLILLGVFVPSAGAAGFAGPAGWSADGLRDHPLVGTAWRAAAGAVMTAEDVRDAVSAAPIVLLGEVHDNADHHRIRAGLLAGKRAAVFEHLRSDQVGELDAIAVARVAGAGALSASEVLARLDWAKSGWPEARLFEPLFGAALAADIAILHGDPARARIREVARGGAAALSVDESRTLGLDRPLPPALEAGLFDELEASHCGLMPRSAFTNMAVAQRYRDAHLAARLKAAQAVHGSAVLLAGNGHVRADRGVPWYLAGADVADRPLVVMFVEVVANQTDPAAYVERDPDGRPTADILVFTPRAARDDPCARMRAQFGKKRS